MNTRIHYEYRDAGNNRFGGEIVVPGTMTNALWLRLKKAQDPAAEGFIAHQVGIPEVFGYLPGDHVADQTLADGYPYDEETDHCWHRLSDGDDAWALVTDPPTDDRTVDQVVRAFEEARKTGWKSFDPRKRFKK